MSEDTLERARFSASRNSPLTETLELCLALVDETTAEDLVPRLPPIIRQVRAARNARSGVEAQRQVWGTARKPKPSVRPC